MTTVYKVCKFVSKFPNMSELPIVSTYDSSHFYFLILRDVRHYRKDFHSCCNSDDYISLLPFLSGT